jgi:general stress protein 26
MSDLKQRIFDAAKGLQLMNIATVTEDGKPRVRYVVGRADEDMAMRFSTHLDSSKIRQLKMNPTVAITMGATKIGSDRWLQLEGVAEVSTTEAERRGFWFEGLKAHFAGPDDPRYCIVIVRPTRIELMSYAWDRSRSDPGSEVWQPEA